MKKLIFVLFIAHCLLQIAYAQQPTEEWVRRYDGLMSEGASGLSVKLDAQGFVYVLVEVSSETSLDDFGVLKYSPSGTLLWEAVYNSPGNLSDQAVAFDVTNTGDVCITGTSGINFEYHITTVKFNTNGVLQWSKIYDGGGPVDGIDDLKIDNLGNIIVIGATAVDNNLTYGLTIKYNTNGDSLWVRKFTQLPQYSHNSKMVIDNSNNIYVVGNYGDTNSDYLILKYAANGLLIWHSTYSSPQNYTDLGREIAIDTLGTIYVVGTNNVPTSSSNNTLVKLNNNGAILWDKTFTGIIAGNGRCQRPKGIAVTPDGSSIYYTTFCSNGTGGGGYDIVTLKYNSSGDTNWIRRYWGGVNAQPNEPTEIKLDRYDNIYLSARAIYPVTGVDYTIIKYVPNGNLSWISNYTGLISNSEDSPSSLVIDTSLFFYVTGTSGFPSLREATTIKYNQPLGIGSQSNQLPAEFKLLQNYPNPFNTSTQIKYQLQYRSYVSLNLYNLLGQKIRTIKESIQNAGFFNMLVNFDELSSGIYILRMIVNGNTIDAKKMILIK